MMYFRKPNAKGKIAIVPPQSYCKIALARDTLGPNIIVQIESFCGIFGIN